MNSTDRASWRVRAAVVADAETMLALMPRLASFDLPPGREPHDLWRHDARLLESWARGDAPSCLAHVAEDDAGNLLGLVLTSLRPELLSSAPSAHLEALVVAPGSEGRGVASALIQAAEDAARLHGAHSMTLHVFSTNRRARTVYARAGYDEELIRCSKPLR